MLNLDMKQIELEMRDTLMQLFYDSPTVINHKDVHCEQIVEPTVRYNYERNKSMRKKIFLIYYKGSKKLAQVQRHPHKKVIVYPFYDDKRYIQKIFERVVKTYLPEVTMEVVDHE